MPAWISVERAEELWRKGQRRPALDGLVERIRSNPSDVGARLALVGFYRELGAPDQAGRWGIALDGVSTEFELDRLARLLAASGVQPSSASRFLALPKGPPPIRVEELLTGPVAAHRKRMNDRAPHPDTTPARVVRAEGMMGTSWLTTMVALLIAAGTVWIVAILDVIDVRVIARCSALVVAALVGVSLVLTGGWSAINGQRGWIAWLSGGILIVAVTLIAVFALPGLFAL